MPPLAGLSAQARKPLKTLIKRSLGWKGLSMSKNDLVVVTGAGGFIGGHLVRVLQQSGHSKIRAVDAKPLAEWYQKTPGVENQVGDLALLEPCRAAAKDARMIYNLAADMGGMGFIETDKADCMLSVRVSTHMLAAAKAAGCE